MEITLDKLLKGKSTIIKDRNYLSTSDYINPFLEQMSSFTDRFVVKVQTPEQMTTTEGVEDITFNRVWIQAILPDSSCIEDYNEVYGLIYGLDVKTPVYKVYRGMLNKACENLCVFDPQWLVVNELKPEENFVFDIKDLMSKVSNFELIIKNMKNKYLSSDIDDKHKMFGKMVEKAVLEEHQNLGGKIKISPVTVISAYNNVYHNTESKYYVGDRESTVFNFYNAFTELIRDEKRDIMNKFEKTLLVNSLFGL